MTASAAAVPAESSDHPTKLSAVPTEISVSEARASLGELVDAAGGGKVIHLTKRGRRVAVLAPEDSVTQVDEAFLAAGARIREHYRDMFDRLADL